MKRGIARGITYSFAVVDVSVLGGAIRDRIQPFNDGNPAKDLAVGCVFVGAALAVAWAQRELEAE